MITGGLRHYRGWCALLIAVAALALWVGWVGFEASDDSLYYAGADAWLRHPPSAGADHWSTRFPLVLAFAAVLATVGRNFIAFAVTGLLFYAAFVALVGRYAHSIGGARAGWIAALLIASLPVVVANATTPGIDLVEASALIAGAMLLGSERAGVARGFAAGLCFGIAILCRETSVLPLAVFAPLFLIGRPVPRRILFAAGIGIVLVLGLEAMFQYALTGDPLRRYAIAFHHDEHIDRAANAEGNVLLWPPIDPLLVLLINDDFGALFWLAGLALALGATRALGENARRRLILLATMAGSGFVLVGALYTKLVLNPRYFMLAAVVATLVLALWLDRLAARWRTVLIAAIIASDLILMGAANAHPRWEMEALVAAARAHPGEIVAGTPADVRRAAIPIAFGELHNIRPAPVAPGTLMIARADAAPAGAIVARYPSPPTRLGGLVRALGLAPLVPQAIAHRLFAPGPEIVLVRTQG